MEFCRLRPEVLGVLGAASPHPISKGVGECFKLFQRGPGWSLGRLTIFLYFVVSRQLIPRYFI